VYYLQNSENVNNSVFVLDLKHDSKVNRCFELKDKKLAYTLKAGCCAFQCRL